MVDKRNTRRREIASGGQREPSSREIQEPAFNMVWNETAGGEGRAGRWEGMRMHTLSEGTNGNPDTEEE